MLLAGCGDGRPLPTVGQRRARDGLAPTVDEVDRYRQIQVGDVMASPGADRTYLVVRVTLENLAHDRLTYRGEELRLLADGREYEPTGPAMVVPMMGSGSIERGAQRPESATFAVPVDARGVVLRYRPSVGGEIRVALPSPADLKETSSTSGAPPPGWPFIATPTPTPRATSPTIPPTPTRVVRPTPSPSL